MPVLSSVSNILAGLYSAPPEKPFVTFWQDEDECQTLTFGEFTQWSERQAAQLHAAGLRPNDRVILLLPQGIELMSVFMGAMMLGAVPAILAYPNFKVEVSKYRTGLEGVSKNLGASMIVIDAAFPPEMLEYLPQDGGIKLVVASGSHSERVALPQLPDVLPSSLAFIQHSAGTTGLQKGVMLSHETVLRQLDNLARAIKLEADDCIYSWLPLYHDMGLVACFMFPLVYHIHLVMQSPTDWVMQPRMMLEAIDRYRCTLCWTPNFSLQFLARRVSAEDRKKLDLSSMRAIINCSEPVRAESVDEFLSVFAERGIRRSALQSSYAMAENVFAVTQSDIDRGPARVWIDAAKFRADRLVELLPEGSPGSLCLVSSGPVIENNAAKIRSNSGEILPEHHVGEIFIRSDSLFDGYFNRADLTGQALREGWYATGDLGFFAKGELFVVGRKKDLIIVAGKNIYPQDVEEIICRHPAIHDGRAVAFGIFNSDLGTEDIVAAAEVEREEFLSQAAEIERALKQDVMATLGVAMRAVYLKPSKWIIKSTAGKAARSSTRNKLMQEHPELPSQDVLTGGAL